LKKTRAMGAMGAMGDLVIRCFLLGFT